jgi:hypothetical protein
MNTVTIRSSQKVFTEDEVVGLTGIGLERLRDMARSRRLGFPVHAAEMADEDEKWFFTNSDLMVLTTLYSRSEH